MAAYLKSNVFSDVYITGNCIIGGTVTSLANPVNSLMTILQDQKASGTNGGGSSVGWQTRTLNTSVLDQIGVNLTTNQFTLPAGTYYVQISTPATQVNNHRCRLYNVTTSSTVLLGTSEIAQNATPGNMTNRSFIDAYFTNASSGTYRVDHYCATAFANNGLGSNASSGDVEIYTTVKIIKINSGAALSQWTTSGTSLIYGSGNVGIGLTNPTSILNVNVTGSTANVYNTTSSAAASTFYVNTADSRRAFVGMDGTGLFALSTGALALGTDNTPIIFAPSYGSGEKMRIATNGYVGIGTTNPGSLLTVSGGVGIGSGYQTTLAPTNGMIVQGGVGIGTTNPGLNALQVTGNVVTQGFTSNATNTVFNFDTVTVPFVNATQVGVGTTAPDNTIDAVGSIVAAPVTFTGASNYGLFFRRGFSTSNFYNCSVMAYDHSGDTNPDGISINGYDGVSICTGSNTRQERVRVLGTNGYVGIGTTNPGYALDVNGSIRTTASLYYSSIRTSRTSLQTATATAFYPLIDISGGAYASKVTIHWNATPSAAAIAFYFIDAGGTNTGVSEYNISYFRAGAYSTGAGNAYLAISNETGTGGVCEFLISKVTGRAHFQTTSTYCWAGVGATRGQGQGYTTGNPNRIVLYSIPANNVDWWAVTENYYT